MKIEPSGLKDFYRVINPDPSLNLEEIYLSSEVIKYLESQGKLGSLEDMLFLINLSNEEWEISDPYPVGTQASIVFYVQGTLQQQDNRILCINPS